MAGRFGRIKNDFSRAEAYAKQAAIREIHYVETLRWKKALVIFFIGFFLGFAVSNFAHASGMTANANYNPANVTITGGTINIANSTTGSGIIGTNSSTGYGVSGTNSGTGVGVFGSSVGGYGGQFDRLNTIHHYDLNGIILFSATAPTISSGFGTGPSITATNGTAAFNLTIGTGGTDSSGIINFPTGAFNGWNCTGSPMAGTAPPAYQVLRFFQSGLSSVTIYSQNISSAAGATVAFSAGEIFNIQCVGI